MASLEVWHAAAEAEKYVSLSFQDKAEVWNISVLIYLFYLSYICLIISCRGAVYSQDPKGMHSFKKTNNKLYDQIRDHEHNHKCMREN